jgi:alpha-N-arabinofuranosidase
MFFDAIRAAYPDIQVVSSAASSDPSSPGVTGPNLEDGFKLPEGAIGDYHPYRKPDELMEEFDRFDNDGGHIVGEVAATHVNGAVEPRWDGKLYKYPWWIGAVGEAVSLLGYERNSDRIPATFYAPVLKNENRFQWPITLIQFTADAKQTTRAVTWYCWSLFAHHPISHTLPTSSNSSYGPLFWAAGTDETRNGAMVWKGAVYNTTNSSVVPVSVHFQGVQPGTKAELTVLTNSIGDPYGYNDPFTGINIVNTTKTELTAGASGAFTFSMPELSVAVLDTEIVGNSTGGYKKRF